MAKRSNYNKLAAMQADERARAARSNPGLLQGLSPTDIALLFPDYFKRGLPDVGGFREAISKKTQEKQAAWQKGVDERVAKQGGWLEDMRKKYSGGGSFAAGKGEIASGQKIVAGLMQRGFTKAEASAIAGNISAESRFNTGVTNSIGAFGLMQWLDTRKQALHAMAAAQGKDPSDLNLQLDFIKKELKGGGHETDQFNRAVAESGGDVSKMSYLFGKYVERPADWELAQSAARRQGMATQLYGQDITPSGESSSAKGPTTPGQQQGQTTPGAPAGDTTAQAGQKTKGTSFNVVSGYIVPQDKNLYDSRNSQQCATLGKAFNPAIGRSSSWTVVDGDIKAGQVVATKMYNNSGPDKVGAGYHTGVALTAPNEKGDFLLLEQYNSSNGAKTRWVNKDSYPAGKSGGTTSWGLISSGGKVHDEVSQEALAYGQQLSTPAQREAIGSNAGAPGTGGEAAPGVAGEVSQGPMGGNTMGEGEQQSASLMQPMGMVQNLMGMMQGGGPMGMMGMMGGMGGQSATPLGLITTAMGFIMPLIGSIAGQRLSGEGMGDAGPRRGHNRHGHSRGHGASAAQGYGRSHSTTVAKATTPSPGAPRQPFTIADPAKAEKLLAFISKGEGSYNAMNQGTVKNKVVGSTMESSKKIGRNLTDMTIGEIMQMQEGSIKSGRKLFAVGAYQIIPKTMKAIIAKTGMSLDQKFDKETQDKLGMALIQSRPKLNAYLTGKSNDARGAMIDFANEWASLPHPDTGKSAHKNGNKSSHSIASVKQALLETRKEMVSGGTQYAEGSKGTQVADATAASSTPTVGPGTTTGTGPATAMTPQGVTQSPFEKAIASVKQDFGYLTGEKPSAASPPSTTTPSSAAGATPANIAPGTPRISPDVSAVAAPTAPMAREARNQIGAYSTFRRSDIEHQFGFGKNMSATVIPQSSVPAAPAALTTPPPVVAAPVGTPVPGPAPDATSAQMSQVRNEIAAFATRENTPPVVQQVNAPPSVNQDHTMKMIQQPYNTPSMFRAFARTNMGTDLPGPAGERPIYGNSQ